MGALPRWVLCPGGCSAMVGTLQRWGLCPTAPRAPLSRTYFSSWCHILKYGGEMCYRLYYIFKGELNKCHGGQIFTLCCCAEPVMLARTEGKPLDDLSSHSFPWRSVWCKVPGPSEPFHAVADCVEQGFNLVVSEPQEVWEPTAGAAWEWYLK